VIALLLTWLAVTVDCHGAPSPVDHYEVAASYGSMQFTDTCPLDLSGAPQRCAVWNGGIFTTPNASLTLADPIVGEVLAYSFPVAVDAAGNRSDEVCP
jgi:hypothetical protein